MKVVISEDQSDRMVGIIRRIVSTMEFDRGVKDVDVYPPDYEDESPTYDIMLNLTYDWIHENEWGEDVETGGTNLKYSELNPEFKQATITEELKDTISEFLNGNIDFVGFEFFGKSARGQKNGHTKTIEDVTDKFNQALDELEQEPDELKDGTIKFTFNIK